MKVREGESSTVNHKDPQTNERTTVNKYSLIRIGYSYWTSDKAMEFDLPSLDLKRKHKFNYGQGWGMTTDGCDLLVTTGSHFIYRLKTDFSLKAKVEVRCDGRVARNLNDLEYVNPKVWVHVWHTNKLLRIDPWTGACEASLNLKGLYNWRGEATPNGVAYSPASLGMLSLLVTGKKWPTMFI